MWNGRNSFKRSVTVRLDEKLLVAVKELHAAEHFGQAEISDVVRTALESYLGKLQESKLRRDADNAKRDAEFQAELQKEKRKDAKKQRTTPATKRRR